MISSQIVLPPSPPGHFRGQRKDVCDKKERGTLEYYVKKGGEKEKEEKGKRGGLK